MREGKGQWVLRIPVSQGFYGEMRKSLSTKALGRWLKQAVRAQWAARNPEALEGLQLLSELEGIIPALETAHAIAYLSKLAPELTQDDIVLLNLSGRGDKDMGTVADALGVTL